MHLATRRTRLAAILAVGASLALPLSAQAATQAHLTIRDFAPDTKTPTPPGGMTLGEWTWGIEYGAGGGSAASGAGSGKATFNDFEFEKPVDAYTPAFMDASVRGTVLHGVRVDVGDPAAPKSAPAFRFCLDDVRVIKDSLNSGDDDGPQEQITMRFGAVAESYTGGRGLKAVSEPMTAWSEEINDVPTDSVC